MVFLDGSYVHIYLNSVIIYTSSGCGCSLCRFLWITMRSLISEVRMETAMHCRQMVNWYFQGVLASITAVHWISQKFGIPRVKLSESCIPSKSERKRETSREWSVFCVSLLWDCHLGLTHLFSTNVGCFQCPTSVPSVSWRKKSWY